MKDLFEFEVITNTGAYTFKPDKKLDNRRVRKDLKKFIKCSDVSMVVYTVVNDLGEMLKDRKFCTDIKEIKI